MAHNFNVSAPFPLSQAENSKGQEHSWLQVKNIVTNTHRFFGRLANECKTPKNFTFRCVETENGIKTRLYFLAVPPGAPTRDNTLMYIDLREEYTDGDATATVWNYLFRLSRTNVSPEFLSKEEQLLRERQRIGSFGMTSYEADVEKGLFVFPACGTLFSCRDSSFAQLETVGISLSKNAFKIYI